MLKKRKKFAKKRIRYVNNDGEKVIKATKNIDKNSRITHLRVWMIIIPVVIVSLLSASVVVIIRDYKDGKLSFLGFSYSDRQSSQTEKETESDSEDSEDNISERLLTIVNSKNPIDTDFEPVLAEFNGIKISADIEEDLKKMLNSAKKDGVMLGVSEGYLTAEEQQQKYDKMLEYYLAKGYSSVKAEATTMRIVATGTTGEHRTGMLLTFTNSENEDFSVTSDYAWLIKNSVKYGFVRRYPDGKKNITGMNPSFTEFRYVGTENAKKMRILDMCLEEYVNYISQQ